MMLHHRPAHKGVQRQANAPSTCHSRHHCQEVRRRNARSVTGGRGGCHCTPSFMHSRAFANELCELVGERKDALALGAGSVVLQTDLGEPLSKHTWIERA